MVPKSPTDGSATSADAIDDAFAALRARDRRYVCYFLLEHGSASVSELADVLTGWIHATDGGIVEPRCRHQRLLRLRHTHVPTLVEAGVVAHDEETDTLTLSPCPDPVTAFVEKARAEETGP